MLPGFVDLQVNGFQGVNFSDPELTLDQIYQVSKTLYSRGTLAFCPTVITSPVEVYERNLPLIAKACRRAEGAQILGIHLEGPFINPLDGARGIHPAEHVQKPSIELFERLRQWADDRIALLTLAPEMESALTLAEHVVRTCSTVVSLGHHLADAETVHRAADAGARACTHIGNGIPEMIHRHQNPLWSVLAEDRLSGLVIADGFHLPQDMLRVCWRSKGARRFIVTSDMTHLAGMPSGDYRFGDIEVILEKNGHLHQKDSSLLAGSASDMLDCMNVMASWNELNETELQAIGMDNALALLGVQLDSEIIEKAPRLQFEQGQFLIS